MSDDRAELAAALRRWRERVSPAETGLPAGTRRRTPGLRREEVAGLAGVSVDYVTRLEQGRGPHPSPSVLGALARALRLSTAEHEHLLVLAGQNLPVAGTIRDEVRPSVARLMDRLADLPAMVVNARGDVVAWNALASALLGDLSATPEHERNLLRWRFVQRCDRVVADEQERARLDRAAVADLRAAAARHPDDRRLNDLVAEMRAASPEFVALWDDHVVEPRRTDRKTYRHPQIGPITLDCEALEVPGDDQTLVVYSAAPGTPDAEQLALLRVLGTQEMTSAGR